jgi:hypothetical protein
MAAIITTSHRRNLAKHFRTNFADTNTAYFIGIGQSQDWLDETEEYANYPFPDGGDGARRVLIDNLTDIIRVNTSEGGQICMPNAIPEDGLYKQYEPFDSSCFYASDGARPPYVINGDGEIYLCIVGNTTATVAQNVPTTPFSLHTIDDTRWVYAGKTNLTSPVNSNRFVVVNDTPLSSGDATAAEAFSANALYGFYVANRGSEYATTPTVKIYSYDEAGVETEEAVTVTATVEDGQVVSVSTDTLFNESGNAFVLKGKHRYAIKISGGGGSGAVVYPNVAPSRGFGADPHDVLPTWYLGFAVNTNVSDANRTTFSRYAQVSLLKDVSFTDSNTALPSYSLLRKISLNAAVAGLNRGDVITQNGNHVGIVDTVTSNEIYYTVGAAYGYATPTFGGGSSLTFTAPGQTPIVTSAGTAVEIPNIDTADVLFIDNRAFITRAEAQNEELKIIIQL